MVHHRIRATRDFDNGIGDERYNLYKSAFSWINKSIEAGYYLEAISILESLATDRLESYLSELLDDNFGFKTLGALIQKIREIHNVDDSTDETLFCLVANDLDEWRKNRNKAAHEMVKIEEGHKVSWDERVSFNKDSAEKGLDLVRKIDKQIQKIRVESQNL